MTHLTLLTIFCLAQIAVGVAIGRRVRSTSDFFVAGRRLGPALLFSTMLAANIGAGSTVGAAGYGYRDGLAAWWWVGSAAIGSIVLALWVGPRIRRLRRDARPHRRSATSSNGATTGASARRPRRSCGSARWSILAGQLLALAFVLEAVAGWPRWVGCLDRRRGDDDLLHRRRHAVDGLGQPGPARGAARRVRARAALRVRRGRRLGGAAAGHRQHAAPTGASGAAAAPAGSSWRCWARRSSSRRACCRRSTARATTARCGSACWPTPRCCSPSRSCRCCSA